MRHRRSPTIAGRWVRHADFLHAGAAQEPLDVIAGNPLYKDSFEAERIDWVPLDRVPSLIEARDIVAGTTLVALLYLLANPGTPRRSPGSQSP